MPYRDVWSTSMSRPLGRVEFGAALGLTLLASIQLVAPDSLIASSRAQTQERIVVAGGAITEVLYALGLQDKIVGVDTTSLFPPDAQKDKASIGYVRAVSAEGVLSLKPTLMMAVDGAGPPDALALLKEAGLKLARIPDDPSVEGIVAKIEAVGTVAGAVDPARRLAARTKAGLGEVATLREALPAKRRVLFILSLQNGRVLVGGRNSTADSIIALAGGINAAADVEGYKPLTDEAIITAAPDAILMMANNNHAGTPEELFARPALSQTPAAARRALIVMDGLYLLGFGPRTPAAARDLMAALYPETTIPALKTAAVP